MNNEMNNSQISQQSNISINLQQSYQILQCNKQKNSYYNNETDSKSLGQSSNSSSQLSNQSSQSSSVISQFSSKQLHHFINQPQSTNSKTTILLNQYMINFEQFLGSGSYGKVYRGYHYITNQQFAVKIIQIIPRIDPKYLSRQIQLLSKLEHKNIVQFFGYQLNQKKKQCYFVMECCDIDLEQLIKMKKQQKQIFTEKQCIVMIMQIFDVFFKFYQQNKLMHRDLKPGNILIKNGILKLTDFGLSRMFNNQNQTATQQSIGTPHYMSPQILNDGNNYTQKCDIWSFGCIIYKILHLQLQWAHIPIIRHHETLLLKKYLNQNQINITRNDLSDNLISFILCCLQKNQHDRSSWKQLSLHPLVLYYKKYIQQEKDSIIQNIYKFYQNKIQKISGNFVKTIPNLNEQNIHKQRLLKYFLPYKVKSFKKLYKASDSNYSIDNFYSTCGNQQHTIIIGLTNKNKIIGGYTPFSHKYTGQFNSGQFITSSTVAILMKRMGYAQLNQNQIMQKYQCVPDNDKKSFLFSLTNDQKFILKNNKQAIQRHQKNKSIFFGSGQLIIGQYPYYYFEKKKKTQQKCDNCLSFNINNPLSSYNFNENYKFNKNQYSVLQNYYNLTQINKLNQTIKKQQGSIKDFCNDIRFTGNKSNIFTFKEWECWQVEFESDQNQTIIQNQNKQQKQQCVNIYSESKLQQMYSKIVESQSTTIQNKQSLTCLLNMFDNKKINRLKLVHKANENNFSSKKFHQTCGNIPNLIILIKTIKQKLLGGYTPLYFNALTSDVRFLADFSHQSFIFSLTNNQKFKLINKQVALKRSDCQNFIIFGASGFKIGQYHELFGLSGCFYLLNDTYCNQKYTRNKDSFLKLTGYNDYQFKIKDWEAFEIQFQ